MNRRQFLATSSLAVIAAALRELPLAAQQPPPTRFTELRRGVGIFEGQGGTIGWLATRDGVLVIDSQFPATAQICLDGLKQRSAHAIDLLVNTHHHGDHTGGNKTFRPLVGAIVAHANSATWQKKAAAAAKTEADQAYPDRTFTDTWTTTMGSEKVSATYYGPGHTSGDSVITFEQANVVHMGDLMFNRLHPFVDRPAGASIRNWVKTLATVPEQHAADTIYIFGHGKEGAGATGNAADLKRFHDYLSAALEYTETQIKAGKSKEEIARLNALPGFEDYASPAPPRISLAGVLTVAYEELAS